MSAVNNYKFYVMFSELAPLHINKDVGIIPEYLSKRGHETYIFAKHPFPVSDFQTKIVKAGIFSILKYLRYERGVKKALFLYFFTLSSKRLLPLIFLKLYNSEIKIIIKTDGVMHGVVREDDYLIKRIGKRIRAFIFFSLIKLDLVLVENPGYMRQILTVSGKLQNRVEVVPNGADEKNYLLSRHKGAYKSIICVGNITFSKGCDDLLKAFELIRRKYPQWKVIFIGSLYDDFRETLLKYRSIMGEQLEIQGYLGGADLYQRFVDASIYVLCSKRESWNLAMVEAMASRNAIITSNCGSVAYITDNGKAGYIYEQSHYEQLSGILDKLMGNSELRRQRQDAAVKRFEEHFQWNKIIDDLDLMIMNLYNRR